MIFFFKVLDYADRVMEPGHVALNLEIGVDQPVYLPMVATVNLNVARPINSAKYTFAALSKI